MLTGWVAAALGIVVLGLLPAATAAAVRYEMVRNPRVVPGTLPLAIWATVQWGGVILVLIALPLTLLPVYVGVVVGGLLVSLLVLALLGRRQEMTAVLNESVRVICRRGGSLADMAEAFARGDASVLAGRARQFADAIRRGVPADQAARRVALPLDPETMLALQHHGQPRWQQVGQESDDVFRAKDVPSATWPMASQAVYFLTLMIGIVLVCGFLMLAIMPTLEQMSAELAVETPISRASDDHQVSWATALVTIVGAALAVLGLLHVAYWITGWPSIARVLLLTGPLLQSQHRGQSLRGVAAAIDAGSEASQALEMVANARYRRAEVGRLRRAAALAASGASLGSALQQGRLLSGRQRPWVDAALATGRVADALRTIAVTSERHARIRFEASSTILFPLGVLACGLLILWVAYLVFGSLVELINAMAQS